MRRLSVSILLSSLFSFPSLFALADTENDKVVFDFSKMTLQSLGVYNPGQDGEQSGLKAESLARKKGLAKLGGYFSQSCEGIDKLKLGVKNGWESSFHSQGTEIYSNGVLVVPLQASVRDIFRGPSLKSKPIKTEGDDRVLFSLPANVPSRFVRCGTVELTYGSNQKVYLLPTQVVKLPARGRVIEVLFDSQVGEFRLKNSQDEAALPAFNLISSNAGGFDVVPIMVVISG